MAALIVLDKAAGDRRIPWDPNEPAQVEEARTKFYDYLGQGFRAYRMGRRGEPGDRIVDFDPSAGEILFTGRHGFQGG